MTNMELDNIKLLRATAIADLAGYVPPIQDISLGLYADANFARWSFSGWVSCAGKLEFLQGIGSSIDDAKRALVKAYKKKLIEATYRQKMEQEMAVLEE
jgi:hypothetical protein